MEELSQIPRYRSLDRIRPDQNADFSGRLRRVMKWYGAMSGTFGTADEVDTYVRNEREAWDR